ncbi:uncharacterized protein DUF11 [Thermomonospora umbrina]|uniref:Uncharacterized protein DUF11 n=2 Tax=Thermomonospora umbrina TaxID=111806 RepID=A0A3D9SRP5_9ACTN|nr:uncharacterized protein DUF11 [Thermomonospora umbrina]
MVIVGVMAGLAVAVAALAWLSGQDGPRRVTLSEDAEGDVRVAADRTVTPSSLQPGSVFRYRFSVTNDGGSAIRQLAVRSEKAATGSSETGLDVRSVSDPHCSGTVRVDCLFPKLGPGETRTVRVEGRASRTGRAGDRVLIHTFPGFLTHAPHGDLTYEVVGGEAVTTGVLVDGTGSGG